MNWALAIARGDYVVILGADDVLHPVCSKYSCERLTVSADGVAAAGSPSSTDGVDRPSRLRCLKRRRSSPESSRPPRPAQLLGCFRWNWS
jgi:hypothetical protein